MAGRTVFVTSRVPGDPVRILDDRCDFLQFDVRPDVVWHDAGRDVQRSITPKVITLANVHSPFLAGLKLHVWTEIAHDDERGRTVAWRLKEAEIHGADLRCLSLASER